MVVKKEEHSGNERVEALVAKLASSRKYGNVHTPTLRRVAASALRGRSPAEAQKRAKAFLHQTWGSYYRGTPDFKKALADIRKRAGSVSLKELFSPALSLQSSTNERLPFLDEFYKQVFAVTGVPRVAVDEGCGLNPLTLPWMGLPDGAAYYGFDIDKAMVEFVQGALGAAGLSRQARISLGDALLHEAPDADVTFMLKLLPPLELQEKGSAIAAMRKAKSRYLVVSFPTATLSGKKKGMEAFYDSWFKNIIGAKGWKFEKIRFPTELVFVVQK
jgi:16S rRNA (guanine(1405)-N(7))-methyltransferase